MDLGKLYGVEQENVDEGVRFQFGTDKDSAWIKCKYAGRENSGYYNAMITLAETHQGTMSAKGKLKPRINNKKFEEAIVEVYSDHIFVAWGNFLETTTGKDGKKVTKAIPNTKDSFKKFALKYPKFFNEIVEKVEEEQNFQNDGEDLKN